MNKNAQYIDINKITADCELVKSILSLHRKCKLKHKEGCFADTCEECLARTFNGYHNHLLPLTENTINQKNNKLTIHDISKERLAEIINDYVNNDYEATESNYIKEKLETICSMDKEEAEALGLGYIFNDK